MLPVKKVLCPTDFSEPSFIGLERANELADHFSAELILVHVVANIHLYPTSPIGGGFNLAGYLEEMVDVSQQSMAEVVKDRVSQNIEVRTNILQGNAADEIVALAESEKVDIIVTATHGWTGWRRFFFGSVTEKVVRTATCPVMTIPGPEEE